MEKITVNAKLVYTLNSKSHWINSFPGALPELPMSEKYLWIDKNGDSAMIGEDFMFAEKTESYPIKIYHLQRIAHHDPKNKSYIEKLLKLFLR